MYTTKSVTVKTNATTSGLKMPMKRALLCGLAGLTLMIPSLHSAAVAETAAPPPIIRQDTRPDLTILGVIVLAKPGGQADPYHVWPKILNQRMTASKPCTLRVQFTKGAGSYSLYYPVPALHPGEAANVTVSMSTPIFAPGTTTLFEADTYNDVDEKNEFNNTYSVVIP